MNRKQMCVANVRYKKPTMNESRRTKNLLKYLTYRDSRDGYVPQVSGQERWVDHGMGQTVSQIAQRCEAYQSDHVLVFTLVINPNPALVEMIPHQHRERFIRELTEKTVEEFFLAREIDTGVEYSWVLHHRQTEDIDTPQRHNPHTHIILPGTYYHADEGRRVPLYFSQNKQVNHIELLHTITEQNMALLMERYIGRDWEQRYDVQYPEIEPTPAIEYAPEIELETPVIETPDIGMSFDL